MFTWICPQCGKEVQPHETECPWCAEAARKKAAGEDANAPGAAAPAGTPASQPPAAQQPAAAQQPPAAAQPPAQAPQPTQAAPPAAGQPPAAGAPPPGQPVYYVGQRKKGLPGFVVALLVAAVLTGAGYLLYTYGLNHSTEPEPTMATGAAVPEGETPAEPADAASGAASTDQQAATQQTSAATTAPSAANLSKYIEATGFRVSEDNQHRVEIQFLLVNHSRADLGDLKGTVTIGSTVDDTKYATVDFQTTRLGPEQSIEFRAVVSTTRRAYEFPDWQLMRGDVEVTAQSGV